MITGDHKITAAAIAKRIGILQDLSEACEGADIEDMSDEELRDFVTGISVYARVSPEHKIRIVRAWQERVAIARAILNKPKVIIADEPTGNLDPETAEKIIQLLRNISQTGTSVVMSTHNLPMLEKYPGIVYRCAEGHLEEVTGDYNKIKMELD